jgi:hypothetical protein
VVKRSTFLFKLGAHFCYSKEKLFLTECNAFWFFNEPRWKLSMYESTLRYIYIQKKCWSQGLNKWVKRIYVRECMSENLCQRIYVKESMSENLCQRIYVRDRHIFKKIFIFSMITKWSNQNINYSVLTSFVIEFQSDQFFFVILALFPKIRQVTVFFLN